MAFSVPVAKNYSSPLNAVPLDWLSEPVEGAKGIQCSIVWSATEAGPNKSVFLNMQNNATLNFSKIRAIVVDNSANGSDVQVVFPDTETTFTIPAYTPYAVVPVFTNQTQFYMISQYALATDKTAFTIMNTMPPVIAVPVTEAQNFQAVSGINALVSGSRAMIPAGVNGTLEAWSCYGFIVGSGTGGSTTVFLEDGNGVLLAVGTANIGAPNGWDNFEFANMTDLRLRFENGINLRWTNANAPANVIFAANVYYRTP